jgi:hypothetical protein
VDALSWERLSTERSWAIRPTQGSCTRLLLSNFSLWKRPSSLCHLDRSAAKWRDLCVDALSWECFSTERSWVIGKFRGQEVSWTRSFVDRSFVDRQKFRGQTDSVSEIEFCTLYVVAERWILGCILRFMHAKNHFSDTLRKLTLYRCVSKPKRTHLEPQRAFVSWSMEHPQPDALRSPRLR